MLTEQEHTVLVATLTEWAERAPEEATIGFLATREPMTPRQLIAEVREQTPEGRAVLDILEHSVRREGLDSVVRTFRRVLD